MTLDQIVHNIRTGTPMALSRWGDGEWLCMRGANGGNCDGHLYFRDLGRRLREIAGTPRPYVMAAQSLGGLPSDRDKYVQDWADADILHRASIASRLDPLIEALGPARVVYTGNSALGRLPFVDEFVWIPYRNAWKVHERTLGRLRRRLQPRPKVFLFSAGMSSNVLIDELYRADPGHLYLDVGSVFDPYAGRRTRTYHETLNITPLA